MNDSILQEVLNNPDYKILKRVPIQISSANYQDPKIFIATIVDLETMGMDPKANEIIEIGLLSFSFTNGDGIINLFGSYNELQDPGKPIPPEITKVTKITDADVHGKAIDWNHVNSILSQSHLIICHNSQFDRNFLELQTPDFVRHVVEKKPFACTIADIDWKSRGYESSKLEYLNFKLGYFYEGHRAIVDCWSTLNLLIQEAGAFDELKSNVRRKDAILCAVNAPFDMKDLLSARKYRWSDGTKSLPKCWHITLKSEELNQEREWLDEHIYLKNGASNSLPCAEINAFTRYSLRAHKLE
jgi:DNA polymerase-3 subunit epsilon